MKKNWERPGVLEHIHPPDCPETFLAILADNAKSLFVFLRCRHFICVFEFCWSMRRISSYFLFHTLTSCWCGMLRGSYGFLRWKCRRCRWDQLEELEEPVDERMTRSSPCCNWFSYHFYEVCFWRQVQWWLYPWPSQSFPGKRLAGVFNKYYCHE